MILLILAGCLGMFYFGAIAATPVWEFLNQGEHDVLASEQPGPIIPPMSISTLLISAFPLVSGGLAALAQILIGVISLFKNKVFEFPSKIASILVLISWAAFFIGGANGLFPAFPKEAFRPLPGVEQNIMLTIFFLAPIFFCNVFSVYISFRKLDKI